jgi:hypothetical protein
MSLEFSHFVKKFNSPGKYTVNNTRNVLINVKLRRVLATIFAAEGPSVNCE